MSVDPEVPRSLVEGEEMGSAPPASPRFGKLLRVFRQWAGLTQRELASSLRVDHSLIQRLEAGYGEPLLSQQLADLAKSVMETLQYLMERDAELPETLKPIGQALTQSVATYLYQYVLQYLTLHSSQVSTMLPVRDSSAVPDIPSNPMQEGELGRHISELQAEAQSPEGKKRTEEQADRLLTLKEAANLYPNEVKYSDVLRWHYSGLLEEKGRRWLTRPGGRSIPLVSQAEVAYLKDNRPPRAPIASFKKKMRQYIDSLKNKPYNPVTK